MNADACLHQPRVGRDNIIHLNGKMRVAEIMHAPVRVLRRGTRLGIFEHLDMGITEAAEELPGRAVL